MHATILEPYISMSLHAASSIIRNILSHGLDNVHWIKTHVVSVGFKYIHAARFNRREPKKFIHEGIPQPITAAGNPDKGMRAVNLSRAIYGSSILVPNSSNDLLSALKSSIFISMRKSSFWGDAVGCPRISHTTTFDLPAMVLNIDVAARNSPTLLM